MSASGSSSSLAPNVYEVERILKSRTLYGGKVEYLIKWFGYDSSENTWEPESNIIDKTVIHTFRAREERRINELKRQYEAEDEAKRRHSSEQKHKKKAKESKHRDEELARSSKHVKTNSNHVADEFNVHVKKEVESNNDENEETITTTASDVTKKTLTDAGLDNDFDLLPSPAKKPKNTGFDRGWIVEQIVGFIQLDDGVRAFLVKWKDQPEDTMELISIDIVRYKAPQETIKYYESIVKFNVAYSNGSSTDSDSD